MTIQTAPAPAPAPQTTPAARPNRLLPAGALLFSALWLWSLRDVHAGVISGWGLLAGLPATWYVAFAGIVLLYGWTLVSGRAVSHALAGAHVALVAVLFGTTAVVYDVPRYPWTYKHIGVVEYLLEHGTVDRSIDIYQNFPGFFYLVAGLHQVTGIPVQDLAQWAQPTFALAAAAAMYWLVGGLTSSLRIRYGAMLLYTLGDWIGQNYFAPQALAFPVALFVLGGLLRSVPPGREGLRFGWLEKRFPTFAAGTDDDLPRSGPFWRSRRAAAVIVLGFAVVVVSHPLSPLLLLAQSVLLCILLRPVRPWLPAVFVLVEVAWLAQAWPFLSSTYDLFNVGLRNVSPPQVAVTDPLPGYTTALWAAPLLMALIGLLTMGAAVAAVVRRGQAARVVVPPALAAVPVALVLLQPYGNEGVFRAYLFALPFMAFVIALHFFDDRPGATPRRRMPGWAAVVAIAAVALPANFAGELQFRVAPSDVAAGHWFEESTPEGSALLPFAGEFPIRGTAGYPTHLPRATEGVESVTDLPGFRAAAGDASKLLGFTTDACATRAGSGPVYLVLGPAAEDDIRLEGAMDRAVYRGFQQMLAHDDAFTRVFRDGDTTVYRCRA